MSRGGGVTRGDSEPSPRVRSPRNARQTGSAARRSYAATGADGGRGSFGGLPPSNPGNDDGRLADSPGTHAVSPHAEGGKDRLDGLALSRLSPPDRAHKSPKQGAMKGDSSRSAIAAKARSVVLEDLPRLDSVLRNDVYLPPNLGSPQREAGVAAGASADPAAAYLDAYAFRHTERSRYSPDTRRILISIHACVRACVRACADMREDVFLFLKCMLFAAGCCHGL